MCGGVEDLRVIREVATQYVQKIQGLVGDVMRHGAVDAVEPSPLLKVPIQGLMDGFLQDRQCLVAVATLGQPGALLGQLFSASRGSFLGSLGGRNRSSGQKK